MVDESKQRLDALETQRREWVDSAVKCGLMETENDDSRAVIMRIWERLLTAEERIARLEGSSARAT